jgi:hypothetical protein
LLEVAQRGEAAREALHVEREVLGLLLQRLIPVVNSLQLRFEHLDTAS